MFSIWNKTIQITLTIILFFLHLTIIYVMLILVLPDLWIIHLKGFSKRNSRLDPLQSVLRLLRDNYILNIDGEEKNVILRMCQVDNWKTTTKEICYLKMVNIKAIVALSKFLWFLWTNKFDFHSLKTILVCRLHASIRIWDYVSKQYALFSKYIHANKKIK